MGRKEQCKKLSQEHCRMMKGKKQEQRLSNQLKKPEREKDELKKLKLSKGRKKQAVWFQSGPILHRDFIGERGFSRSISPFQEIIEKRGWHLFCEHKALGFVDVLKEFYTNMVGMKEKTMYVIGKWISVSRENIDQTFNLNERKNGTKFKKLVKEPDFQKIVDLLTDGKGKWNAKRKNSHESIARGSLTEQAKVWFYFICLVILPSKLLSTVRENKVVLLYAILKGYKFNVGKIIENSILSYYRGSYKGLVPHPALITRLCILGDVEGDWEEEETCPKTSPLH